MKRYPLPDLLKGFAVFLIIPVHILELFINPAGKESLFGKILLFLGGPIAVPVFMIVMGYFIAKNRKPFSVNLFRGIKVFLLGFVLNIGLNFHLLFKIKFSGWQINPLEYIFGVDILYLAGLSILLLSALKKLKKAQGVVALLLTFTITGLTACMNSRLSNSDQSYIVPFIAGIYHWSYFPLFPWLAYPVAGFAFYHFEEKIVAFFERYKKLSRVIPAAILLVLIFSREYGFQTTINLSAYYHHTFWFSMWALGLVILWALTWRYILKKFPATLAGDFFKWMGKNITLFYIIQWLIIGNIATAVYQTQKLTSYPFWFAGLFSITVLLTWLIGKTPIKLA